MGESSLRGSFADTLRPPESKKYPIEIDGKSIFLNSVFKLFLNKNIFKPDYLPKEVDEIKDSV